MDATLSLTGLIEEFNAHLEAKDFEGAELLLEHAIQSVPQFEPFIHFQYGRLYKQWNKLSSASNHLVKAAELALSSGDRLFLLQVTEELKSVKSQQSAQRP